MQTKHDEQFFKIQPKWAGDVFDAERVVAARDLLMELAMHLLATELDEVREQPDVTKWTDAQLARWTKDLLGRYLMHLIQHTRCYPFFPLTLRRQCASEPLSLILHQRVVILIATRSAQRAEVAGLALAKRCRATSQNHRRRLVRNHLGAIIQRDADWRGIDLAKNLPLAGAYRPTDQAGAEWDTCILSFFVRLRFKL
jgi:hypothetical protein